MTEKRGSGGRNGVKFGEGQKSGRKKKITTLLKEQGFTTKDVKQIYSVLAAQTVKQLEKVVASDFSTVLEVSIAKAYLKACHTGDYRAIKDVVELFAGKAIQHTTSDSKTETKINIISLGKGEAPKIDPPKNEPIKINLKSAEPIAIEEAIIDKLNGENK